MKSEELVSRVAEALGKTKAEAKVTIREVFGVVKTAVNSGEDVSIVDFGSFKKGTRAARNGVNPSTGEKIQIGEKTVVKFKPSTKFFD